ncbi:hypothetical protein [Nonomuraea dietziae]|uniref:hypothetical protein n=1 Tax=Nonomuraea dietziae TaxID=65515 RepID=UPI0033C401D8
MTTSRPPRRARPPSAALATSSLRALAPEPPIPVPVARAMSPSSPVTQGAGTRSRVQIMPRNRTAVRSWK